MVTESRGTGREEQQSNMEMVKEIGIDEERHYRL